VIVAAPPLAPLDARSLQDASPTSQPWTSDQVTRVLVLNAIGLAVICAGAFETTTDELVRTRLSWLEVSVLGLAIAAVANGLWLLRLRRTLSRARAAVLDPTHRHWLAGPSVAATGNGAVALVAGASMTRYHVASCQLVEGRPTTARPRAEHERAGRSPCEVCTP
jgi:hypothetical protein